MVTADIGEEMNKDCQRFELLPQLTALKTMAAVFTGFLDCCY